MKSVGNVIKNFFAGPGRGGSLDLGQQFLAELCDALELEGLLVGGLLDPHVLDLDLAVLQDRQHRDRQLASVGGRALDEAQPLAAEHHVAGAPAAADARAFVLEIDVGDDGPHVTPPR